MGFGSFNTARAFIEGVRNYEHGEERAIFLELRACAVTSRVKFIADFGVAA